MFFHNLSLEFHGQELILVDNTDDTSAAQWPLVRMEDVQVGDPKSVPLSEIFDEALSLIGRSLPRPLDPEEAWCRKCGAPVRYADVLVRGGRRAGASFDAEMVPNGGYVLTEEVIEIDGAEVATGRWKADYVRVSERPEDHLGFRQHSCKPEHVNAMSFRGGIR